MQNGVVYQLPDSVAYKERVLDSYLPPCFSQSALGHPVVLPETDNRREGGLVQLHKDYTNQGENVAIVGGGVGVSSIVAAQQVGEEGSVTVYEGAKSQFHALTETISFNDMERIVTPRQAAVGSTDTLYPQDSGIDQYRATTNVSANRSDSTSVSNPRPSRAERTSSTAVSNPNSNLWTSHTTQSA